MTSVFEDSRVRREAEYSYRVYTDDIYIVSCWTSETSWSWKPDISTSRAAQEANIGSREEAEEWSRRNYHGPFYSAELALQDCIAHTG